ncbi:MAG: electron transport complex protein RnfG [Cellvibrionaceae bacterium]|jgi:electron transport complex protein RnfG
MATNDTSLPLSMSKNSILLLLFAIVTAGILASTYEGTKEAIATAERKAAEKALLEIVPADRIDNDLLLDTIPVPESAWQQLGLNQASDIHIARSKNKVVAVILPIIAPDGYSGAIKMIAGINSDGSIAGVRVLSHNETPGLGDKVDIKKSNWITSFDKKSLINPVADLWKVKKDGGTFDQFTGATITPRAVVKQIKLALEFVNNNPKLLFKTPQGGQRPPDLIPIKPLGTAHPTK